MPDGPAPDSTGAARRTKAALAADGYVYSPMPVVEGKALTLVYSHDCFIYLYVCAWHGAGIIILFSSCYFIHTTSSSRSSMQTALSVLLATSV